MKKLIFQFGRQYDVGHKIPDVNQGFFLPIKSNINIGVMTLSGKQKEPQFQSGQREKEEAKGLYGLDPETSLLSVNFATTENPYLNEHYQEDSKEN